MRLYKALLKHDKGQVYVTVIGKNVKDAKAAIMELEHCPQRAIINIHAVKRSK